MPMWKGVKNMSKTRVMLALALVLAASAGAPLAAEPGANPAADTNLSLLLDAIRSNRKALVAVNLNLSEDEAARFWPIYDRYLKEVSATGDRLAALVQDYTASYRDLSNEKAMKLMEDYLAIEA